MQEWQGPAEQAAHVGAPIPPTVRFRQKRFRSFPSQQAPQPLDVVVLSIDVAIFYDVSQQIILRSSHREQTENRASRVGQQRNGYGVVAHLTCKHVPKMVNKSSTVTSPADFSGSHDLPAFKSLQAQEL